MILIYSSTLMIVIWLLTNLMAGIDSRQKWNQHPGKLKLGLCKRKHQESFLEHISLNSKAARIYANKKCRLEKFRVKGKSMRMKKVLEKLKKNADNLADSRSARKQVKGRSLDMVISEFQEGGDYPDGVDKIAVKPRPEVDPNQVYPNEKGGQQTIEKPLLGDQGPEDETHGYWVLTDQDGNELDWPIFYEMENGRYTVYSNGEYELDGDNQEGTEFNPYDEEENINTGGVDGGGDSGGIPNPDDPGPNNETAGEWMLHQDYDDVYIYVTDSGFWGEVETDNGYQWQFMPDQEGEGQNWGCGGGHCFK